MRRKVVNAMRLLGGSNKGREGKPDAVSQVSQDDQPRSEFRRGVIAIPKSHATREA